MDEIKPLSRHQDWDAHPSQLFLARLSPGMTSFWRLKKIPTLVQAKIPSWQGGYASPQINEVMEKAVTFLSRIIGDHWISLMSLLNRVTVHHPNKITKNCRFFFCLIFFLPIRSVWQMSWLFLEPDGNISFEFEWLVPLSWFQIFTWKFHEIVGKQLYTNIQYTDTFHRTNLPNWIFLATLISCVPQNMGPNECFAVIKPIPSMYNRFTYIWSIFYGKCREIYQSHGWYGKWLGLKLDVCWKLRWRGCRSNFGTLYRHADGEEASVQNGKIFTFFLRTRWQAAFWGKKTPTNVPKKTHVLQ